MKYRPFTVMEGGKETMLTAIIIIIVLALFVEWDMHPVRSIYRYLTEEKPEQKEIESLRYGSKVLITSGSYRDLEGEICGSKIGSEWHVKINVGKGAYGHEFSFLPERNLRLIESPVLPNRTMGVTTQQAAQALTEAFTSDWYSIWIDDGIVSERYGAGQYETEAKAVLICTALQMSYMSLCYECTFTPKLRANESS